MRCLITMDDNGDVLESDTRQPTTAMLAREEFARLMGRAERNYKKEVCIEKQDLRGAAED